MIGLIWRKIVLKADLGLEALIWLILESSQHSSRKLARLVRLERHLVLFGRLHWHLDQARDVKVGLAAAHEV